MQVGVGLDLCDPPNDQAAAERAAVIARSAFANEIRLGELLAAVARRDPPDYRVVLPVQDAPEHDPPNVHRLANARDEVPNNLLPALTSFVGREAEISEVRQLIGGARLVTVTGPPGVGKTRLAAEIAERLLGRFEDGVWFVGLAPLGDPSLLIPVLANVLGLAPDSEGSPIDRVAAHLKSRHMMVILDNFEHISDEATELVTLLEAAPALQLLVTSRVTLHLSAEHELVIPPLEIPAPGADAAEVIRSEAVDLFTRRAVAADPGFRLADEDAQQVGELCRRLDGLPLAIELAAVRVKLLPLPAILARLDHRLALLTGGPKNAPARHQSLRAAVAWSYDLLEPPAQRLFQALSIFRGGWAIDGAVAVSGAGAADQDRVMETLASLLDASLIVRRSNDSAIPRFTMLETLREFAAERLDEAGETAIARGRHAAYCIELVERYESEFTGADRADALDTTAIEHDNLRSALDYLLIANPVDALRLSSGVWRFWQMRGHLVEGGRWLTSALQAAGDEPPEALRAKALAAAGGLAYWRGDMAEAQRHYEGAVALRRGIGDNVGIADALYDLAFALGPFNRPPPQDPERTEEAVGLAEQAGAFYEIAGDEPGVAKSGWLLGTLALYRDMERAKGLLQESVARFRTLDDPFGLGWALRTYGLALMGTAETAAADGVLAESAGAVRVGTRTAVRWACCSTTSPTSRQPRATPSEPPA